MVILRSLPLDDLFYANDLFHCVSVAGLPLGLHWVKNKSDGRKWGVAICKVAS